MALPNFNKINPTLDKEHRQIIRDIQVLYTHCIQHFQTEENMFQTGFKKLPKDHTVNKQNLLKEWDEHKKEHNDFLEKLKEIGRTLIKHIEEKDTIHFHWSAQ